MVLVRAPWKFLELLVPLEILKAYRAGVLDGVAPLHPCALFDTFDLSWRQTLGHLTISVLELQELFIGHVVSIGVVWVSVAPTRFYGLLQQALLLRLDPLRPKHTIHHGHHYHLFFSFHHLLPLHLHGEGEFFPGFVSSSCAHATSLSMVWFWVSRSLSRTGCVHIILGLVFEFSDFRPEVEVLLPQVGQVRALLVDHGILVLDNLFHLNHFVLHFLQFTP